MSNSIRAKRVVLAFSGGVDTSVCVPYLINEWGVEEVICVVVDVGQSTKAEIEAARRRALDCGAIEALAPDVRLELVKRFAFPAIQTNALYEGRYPLTTSLARPIIVEQLVEVAHKYDADAVAHGCTGKGNDQVRFDVGIRAIDPTLKILAPAREWGMSREQSIEYGEGYGLTFSVAKKSPYSIDANLLGRSIEAGILEDPRLEPPEDIYSLTQPISRTPDEPEYITIQFEKGVPVGLNGERPDPVTLITTLNQLAGEHGIGQIDMIENRVIGIKSRQIYEAPAMIALIEAHRSLESLTLPASITQFKRGIEDQFTRLVYGGLWNDPLRNALDAFVHNTQERVSGLVTLKLFKGRATVTGLESPNALYDEQLATYGVGDQFDHRAAEGFIYVTGLPITTWNSALAR